MIQEFKIKNFLSFRDETTLNFEATKDDTFEEYQVVEVAPGIRLLRFSLVYGANASGKSNLLVALNYLHKFWFERKEDMDLATNAIPFLLDTETSELPSEFEIKFYIGSTKFWYMLSLDKKKVISEKLYYYKSVQPTMLFSREWEQEQSVIKFNPTAVKVSNTVLEELMLKCLPNMSFFAARNQVNCSLPLIDNAWDWMKKGFLPTIESKTQMSEYAGNKILDDNELKQYILSFIKQADFNITGITAKRKSVSMPIFLRSAIMENNQISESTKEKIVADPVYTILETDFEHTVRNKRGIEKYTLPNLLQSEGTRRTIGIEAAIYEALKNEKVLSIDEIESSLHPDLVEFIIEQFLKTKNRSQLLITSHYDPLLNTVDDLIRKDSIWFTEKGEDGNSKLYSLVEFKGLNKISSFQRSYRNGAFGALLNIKG
ncbi:MAG: ATP-binding protein [Mediterranea sp.]|jgi:AAA15 family ATPase/GTPase|nr:ATP-binding protein [Mediterranea sp.]